MLELTGRDVQKQKLEAKIKESKYAREMKDIILKETGRDYLGKEKGMRKEKLNSRQDTEWVIKTKHASIG